MIEIRKSNERGHVDYGWLDTYLTFSFGDYYDPNFMEFAKLRVINEDKVIGGRGFDSHPHKDMEIITYILDGELSHKDSMGNSSVIRKGDLQKMTAGKGIFHSEYNNSDTETVHLLQIWIYPDELGLKPAYEQIHIDMDSVQGKMELVASGNKKNPNEIIHVNQDVDLYIGVLNKGQNVSHSFDNRRNVWLQVTRGSLSLPGYKLSAGDAAAITDESEIEITAEGSTEFLLFEMN